jgi:hypothetical protein
LGQRQVFLGDLGRKLLHHVFHVAPYSQSLADRYPDFGRGADCVISADAFCAGRTI